MWLGVSWLCGFYWLIGMVFGMVEWMVSGVDLYLNEGWSVDGACVCVCVCAGYVSGVWLEMDSSGAL